jgi:hypothetical protein
MPVPTPSTGHVAGKRGSIAPLALESQKGSRTSQCRVRYTEAHGEYTDSPGRDKRWGPPAG